MESAYSKALLVGALLSFTLSLQGCAKPPVCEDGPVSTQGVVNGKIEADMLTLAKVTCNAGTTYQGPQLWCTAAMTKVCAKSDVSMLNCTTLPGYWKADQKPPDAVMVPDGTDLAAEAKLTAAKIAVTLSEDKEVVCTPWPASAFQPFKSLTEPQRKAAQGLGYKEDTWNKDEKNEVSKKTWAQLTEKQQKDATTLGFTQISWDWNPKPLAPDGTKADTAKVVSDKETTSAKEAASSETTKKFIVGVKVALGSITPMDVSMVLAMCLVLAVSIRAVSRRKKQRNLNSIHQQDPELLEGHLSDSDEAIPE